MASSPSTTRNCSRANSGIASVQPEQTSVTTRLLMNEPATDSPQWCHHVYLQVSRFGFVPVGEGANRDPTSYLPLLLALPPTASLLSDGLKQSGLWSPR